MGLKREFHGFETGVAFMIIISIFGMNFLPMKGVIFFMNKLFFCLLLIFLPISERCFASQDAEMEKRFQALDEELHRISNLDRQRAQDILDKMYSLSYEQPDSLFWLNKTLYAHTVLQTRQHVRDNSLQATIQKHLSMDNLSLYEKTILMLALSKSYLSQGDYSEAFNNALIALEWSLELDDSFWISRAYNNLGTLSHTVRLFDLAEDYYLQALEWSDPTAHPADYYATKMNFYTNSINWNNLGNVDAFVDSLYALMDTLESHQEIASLAMLHNNMGVFLWDIGKREDAYINFRKAEALIVESPDFLAAIYDNLGRYYVEEAKDYQKALEYFRTVQNIVEASNNYFYLSITYDNISSVYAKLNESDSALYYARKALEAVRKDNNNARVMETHRKYITTFLETSQNKLSLAQVELDLKNKQVIITIISLLSVIVLSLLLLTILWQKRKSMKQNVLLREAEAKELASSLEKEQALQKVQADQLDSKLRELTSYSLLLSNKNQILNEILKETETIPDHVQSKQRIDLIIRKNLRTDDDWEDFMLHFNQVHSHFFDNIRAAYPSVSNYELRLMAYIRLGLSAKEIAQMFSVTHEAVWNSRSRLKKKLGMEKDVNLDEYIQAF